MRSKRRKKKMMMGLVGYSHDWISWTFSLWKATIRNALSPSIHVKKVGAEMCEDLSLFPLQFGSVLSREIW